MIFSIFKYFLLFVLLVFMFTDPPVDNTSHDNLAFSSDCVYDVSKDITFTHNIKRTRNYSENVETIAGKAKQCNVKLQAFINDKWINGNGSFIYGPDTAERSACYMAAEKAKSNALQSFSPEVITAKIRNKCETRS